jgi:hypothetical protein
MPSKFRYQHSLGELSGVYHPPEEVARIRRLHKLPRHMTENEVMYLAKDTKTKTLQEARCTSAEFVALLSPHVLDRYRHSMRYFGLLAPRTKSVTSAAVFAFLGQRPRGKPQRQRWTDSLKQHFRVDPLIDEFGIRCIG